MIHTIIPEETAGRQSYFDKDMITQVSMEPLAD
jgi:hypothetical protein